MIQAIIKQRGEAYGDYRDQAEIARKFKSEIEKHTEKMTATQREALDMIAVKISRLINGDPWHRDSWVDIVGYATLVISELDRAIEAEDNAEEEAIEESVSEEEEAALVEAAREAERMLRSEGIET